MSLHGADCKYVFPDRDLPTSSISGFSFFFSSLHLFVFLKFSHAKPGGQVDEKSPDTGGHSEGKSQF